MDRFENFRVQRTKLKEEFLSHKPTTDILEKIKTATPTQGLLTNVLITPEIARDLLTMNTDNRPADIPTIQRYAKFMEEKKWVYIGDVIRITKTMQLVDAQQRLLAIIQTNSSIPMHIQTGLDEASFGVIDSGRTRTAADALAIAGYKDVNVLGAAIKAEIYFRTLKKVGARVARQRVQVVEVIEWAETNDIKLMQHCVEHAINRLNLKGKFLSQSNWAYLYYTLQKIRGAKTDAIRFCEQLATGENISLGDISSPIYLLRERLQNIRVEALSSQKEIDLKVRYFITAWNHYRQREVIKKLIIDTKQIDLPTPR